MKLSILLDNWHDVEKSIIHPIVHPSSIAKRSFFFIPTAFFFRFRPFQASL
jgi:hypothetical protein